LVFFSRAEKPSKKISSRLFFMEKKNHKGLNCVKIEYLILGSL
jgi:hypothetical protein